MLEGNNKALKISGIIGAPTENPKRHLLNKCDVTASANLLSKPE
jgi:hypothetical protein